jgi:hypothetical protein
MSRSTGGRAFGAAQEAVEAVGTGRASGAGIPENTMLASRIALTLALLPALTLASGCDEKQKPEPNGGEVADSDDSQDSEDEGETKEEEESDGPSGSTGDIEGEDESGSTSNGQEEPPAPPPPAPAGGKAQPCVWSDTYHDERNYQECTTAGGLAGESFCVLIDGEEVWTECFADPVCEPGEGEDYGCMGNVCAYDGEKLYWYSWSEDDCNTPLVLNFDGAPLTFTAATAASFDITGAGECVSTDWPTLPWLALDRDGDGTIESGRELFGNGSVLASGARASHGFEALAEFDANLDGTIDAADPVFAELVLWADDDGDRRGELAEMTPVGNFGLVAIHLDVAVRGECDGRGNCGCERASFEFRAPTGEIRTGEVVDVYLACQ